MKILLRSSLAVVLAGSVAVAVLEFGGLDVAAFARGTAGGDYVVSAGSGSIVPGTGDIGNHCDDCVTQIFLPFPYTLYDQTFTVTQASSNGNLQFLSASTEFSNTPLPNQNFNSAILPYWDDLITTVTATGIFTSTTGSAPNRILNIEWRARPLADQTVSGTTNFEVRLYEGQTKFDFVYGQLKDNGASATIGVQRDTGSKFTQWSFNQASVGNGTKLTFTLPPTAAVIRELSAIPVRRGIAVRWRTASDIGLLGFNLWRMGARGELRRINMALIWAKGHNSGSSYRFVDRSVRGRAQYTYRLQVVRVSGASSWSSFATARAR